MLPSDRVQWIFHNKVKILSVDYRALRWNEDFIAIFKVAAEVLDNVEEARTLVDVTGSYISSDVMQQAAKIFKSRGRKIVIRAIIGASSSYKLNYFQFTAPFNMNTQFFNDRQKGLDYLANLDAKKTVERSGR